MVDSAVLGRDAIINLVAKSSFYPVGGPFTSVGQLVASVWVDYVKSASTSCCGPKPQLLFPAIDELFRLLREEGETGDAARKSFKNYLTNNKGYEVRHVILYYRRGTELTPEKLEF
jgi:hypothetical protein